LRRTSLLLAVVALLIPTLVSCQPSTQKSNNVKTVIYVTPSLALTMDGCKIPGNQTAEILQNLYPLWTNYTAVPSGAHGLRIDDTKSGEANIKPGALESWQVSPDGLVWTLHVRPGIRDAQGNEVTATDFKWDLVRVKDCPPSNFCAQAGGWPDPENQVQVVDRYTVRVTLKSPNAIFLRILNVNACGFAYGPEVEKHVTAADPLAENWLQSNAPATGPYVLQSWTPGVEQVLVANPHYYGPKPNIQKIIYKEVPESSSRLALLLSGEAQIARDLTQDELDQVTSSNKAYPICVAANRFVVAKFNFTSGHVTRDLKLRQALSYAVPYQAILSSVYHNRAKPLYGFAPDDYAYAIGASGWPYTYDLAKAKALLAQSSVPNGTNLTILASQDIPEHQQIAILLQNSFKQIGVNLTIDVKPNAAYNASFFSRTGFDLIFDQNTAIVVDPQYHANVWYADGPPPNSNSGGFTNPEFSSILTTSLPDGPQRMQNAILLQQIVIQQAAQLSLANAPTCFGFANGISGYGWHTHNQIIFSELSQTG
jgi:peptide/nickel transport system substrate-binding protein